MLLLIQVVSRVCAVRRPEQRGLIEQLPSMLSDVVWSILYDSYNAKSRKSRVRRGRPSYIGTSPGLIEQCIGFRFPVDNGIMRSTYLFLSVAATLASAFFIPDETILAEMVSETRPTANDHSSQADSEMSLLGISPDEHRGWRRDRDWRDDDEDPEHGDWPGYDNDPHGRRPGGDRPEHGGWPGHRGDGEDRHDRDGRPWDRYRHCPHRPIDACPGPLCHAEKTTWELIKESEHTSRLAELIAHDKDLVEILNSTTANHTFETSTGTKWPQSGTHVQVAAVIISCPVDCQSSISRATGRYRQS